MKTTSFEFFTNKNTMRKLKIKKSVFYPKIDSRCPEYIFSVFSQLIKIPWAVAELMLLMKRLKIVLLIHSIFS